VNGLDLAIAANEAPKRSSAFKIKGKLARVFAVRRVSTESVDNSVHKVPEWRYLRVLEVLWTI
jgi:hypothetical protein